MRRTLLPVAALLALLATTGCTAALTPSTTDPAAQPERHVDAPSQRRGGDTVVLTTDQPDEDDDDQEEAQRVADELSELAFGHDAQGSASEIALRFMQALQRRDDLAAAREVLGAWQIEDAWQLHRVMDDVRRHAALDRAGPCTRALAFKEDLVLVACGAQRVMVQASTGRAAAGVSIFDRPWRLGEYRHPHTWAITTVEL